MSVAKQIIFIALVTALMSARPALAQDADQCDEPRTFGGYDCTEDCSGHKAGYDWAEDKQIEDADDCPSGHGGSFHDGCQAYTEDSHRESDEDDQGNPIEQR